MDTGFCHDRSQGSETQGLRFWWYILRAWFADKMRSPVFAIVTLLVAGTLFAAIVISTYPDAASDIDSLPVLQAETTPYKTRPDQQDQIDTPYRDTTVFQAMRGQDTPVIENLLVSPSAGTPDEEDQGMAASRVQAKSASLDRNITADIPDTAIASASDKNLTDISYDGAQSNDTDLVSKSNAKPSGNAAQALTKVPTTKPTTTKSNVVHPPGSSPETLEFVRSVLDKETKKEKTAHASGNSYVQLGSVKNEAGAKKEWENLKTSLPGLSGLQYRIQRADLGAKGIYYRIQAGPLSSSKAVSLCKDIKAKKPGGCLVVR